MAFKSLKFQGFFIVESALGLSSWFTGPALKYSETNNSNTNITELKNQLAGGNQLAIYKCGREFELGTMRTNPASGLRAGTRSRDHRIASPTRWPLGHAAFLVLKL